MHQQTARLVGWMALGLALGLGLDSFPAGAQGTPPETPQEFHFARREKSPSLKSNTNRGAAYVFEGP